MADVSFPSGGSLATAPRKIGRGRVLWCDWWDGTADLVLAHLADTEGDVKLDPKSEIETLKVTELFGSATLEAWEKGGDPELSLSLFLADPALRPILTPTGGTGGAGNLRRKPVKYRTLVVLPEEIFVKADGTMGTALTFAKAGGGVWKLDGVAFTAEQTRLLDLSLWIWRCFFMRPPVTFKTGDGDKAVDSVSIAVCQDVTKPDGQQLYTRGDPADVGIDIDPVA
jgi:hypothetical protein